MKGRLQKGNVDDGAQQENLKNDAEEHFSIAEESDFENRFSLCPAVQHRADLAEDNRRQGHGRRFGINGAAGR